MAEKIEKKEAAKKEASKIKTKTFTLKKPINGKNIGDKVKLGEKGEMFYKRNNTI